MSFIENYYENQISAHFNVYSFVEQFKKNLVEIEAIPTICNVIDMVETWICEVIENDDIKQQSIKCVECFTKVALYSQGLIKRSYFLCIDVLFIKYVYCISCLNQMYSLEVWKKEIFFTALCF